MQREDFQNIRNFVVSYGQSRTRDMESYDVAIVEPARHTREEIQSLQAKDTFVLAYVSVMEMHTSHQLWPKLSSTDFLKSAGERIYDGQYDTYLLDLTSSSWRGILLRHIGELITVQKYNGVFLDTIGDVERTDIPNAWMQVNAAVSLVEEIRNWFEGTIIVQNNGLELLCDRTATYLDGIIWENPPIHQKLNTAWVQLMSEKLKNINQKHQMKTLLLFDGAEEMKRVEWLRKKRFADFHRFVLYIAPRHYQGDICSIEPQE